MKKNETLPPNFRQTIDENTCNKCDNAMHCSVIYCTKHLYHVPQYEVKVFYVCDDFKKKWSGKKYDINGKDGPVFINIPEKL